MKKIYMLCAAFVFSNVSFAMDEKSDSKSMSAADKANARKAAYDRFVLDRRTRQHDEQEFFAAQAEQFNGMTTVTQLSQKVSQLLKSKPNEFSEGDHFYVMLGDFKNMTPGSEEGIVDYFVKKDSNDIFDVDKDQDIYKNIGKFYQTRFQVDAKKKAKENKFKLIYSDLFTEKDYDTVDKMKNVEQIKQQHGLLEEQFLKTKEELNKEQGSVKEAYSSLDALTAGIKQKTQELEKLKTSEKEILAEMQQKFEQEKKAALEEAERNKDQSKSSAAKSEEPAPATKDINVISTAVTAAKEAYKAKNKKGMLAHLEGITKADVERLKNAENSASIDNMILAFTQQGWKGGQKAAEVEENKDQSKSSAAKSEEPAPATKDISVISTAVTAAKEAYKAKNKAGMLAHLEGITKADVERLKNEKNSESIDTMILAFTQQGWTGGQKDINVISTAVTAAKEAYKAKNKAGMLAHLEGITKADVERLKNAENNESINKMILAFTQQGWKGE